MGFVRYRQSRGEAEVLVGRIRESLDVRGVPVPRVWLSNGFRDVDRGKFKLSVNSGGIRTVRAVVLTLCLYGYYRRTVGTAVLLEPVDRDLWEIDLSYVERCFLYPYYFAVQAGDEESVGVLEPLQGYRRRDWFTGEPRPLREDKLRGEWLRNPLELGLEGYEKKYWQDYYSEKVIDSLMIDDIGHDIGVLLSMWADGGSDVWPRERIVGQVDRLIEALQSFPGRGPWSEEKSGW
ncbi:hypothetical protein FYJ24_07360 [Actinomycetaceae bacterium WB03_NA08]|uniref:Uncharacterized protein n=1 Tax=Scrofimicrobium canadense TaxID=2652290 RepID=A0A6N7W817_9ACTO|nr:hypothetical protein [Scrofimicrobium canadense]MSS84582.1 hypothetical protein [Scrofimicrobium canadense]